VPLLYFVYRPNTSSLLLVNSLSEVLSRLAPLRLVVIALFSPDKTEMDIIQSPLTPFDTDPDIPQLDAHQMSHNSPCSPQGSGRPLPTPPQPSPLPRLSLHPQSNTSAYEFVEDFRYVLSHEPLDTNGGNLLSLPDNVRALWTQIGHLQQIIESRDRRIHAIELQFNEVLQTLAALQLSHQNLQDTIHHSHQEVDEEVVALWSQLNFVRERHPIAAQIPVLTITPGPGSPIPPATTSQVPVTSNTTKLNLKPAKPEVWNGTKRDAKPFRNRVLNYLGSFSGAPLSKQVVFILSLTTHAKSQSWMNTCQDWLANNPAHLPPTITMLLDDFVREFGDRNAAISAQHWLDTTSQGRRSVAQFNNNWLAKVEEAEYMDTLPLVSHYLRHLCKPVQEAILALDMMPVGLDETMSVALDRKANLIRKAGLIPVMQSFQGVSSPYCPNTTTLTTPSPSNMTSSLPNPTSRFVNLAPPNIPKNITDKDLVAAMSKPFTSTKGNNTLRSKMLANQICLICRWHKSHATGCPRATEHAQAADTTVLLLTATLEEVKEDETDFLNGGL